MIEFKDGWLLIDGHKQAFHDPTDPEMLGIKALGTIARIADQLPIHRALHIGGGLLSLPRYIRHRQPSDHVVIEANEKVIDLIERMHLDDDPYELGDITVIHADGAKAIRGEPSGAYDLVIRDAFVGTTVPEDMRTTGFAREVLRVLVDEGCYVVHTIGYPPLDVVRAEMEVLTDVFEAVITHGDMSGTYGGAFVLEAYG